MSRRATMATLRAFVVTARAHPVSIGHAAIGTSRQLALTMLERRSGVEMVQVPFTGSAPTKTWLIGGRIDDGCSCERR